MNRFDYGFNENSEAYTNSRWPIRQPINDCIGECYIKKDGYVIGLNLCMMFTAK